MPTPHPRFCLSLITFSCDQLNIELKEKKTTEKMVIKLNIMVSSPCSHVSFVLDLLFLLSACVSKITFAILPKSAADFLHTGSPWAARADNKIKYYVPTINTNCIALYEYRVEYTYIYRNLVGNFRAN